MVDNELLQAIGQMMDKKLEQVQADMSGRMERMDQKLEQVQTNMSDMMDKRLEQVQANMSDMMDKRLEQVQANMSDMMDKKLEKQLTPVRKDIQTIKHDIKEISFKVDVLYDWMDTVDLKVKDIDNRTA